MAATVRIGKDYMVTPGVTSQFMFSTKPGEWSVTIPDESDLIPGEPGNSVLTPVKYSPFPVVAGRPVTITATLHNYGSAPGRVGPVAVWLCADTGRYWSRYAEYALNKQINVSSTVDYTRRVLRPGQALTVCAASTGDSGREKGRAAGGHALAHHAASVRVCVCERGCHAG